MGPTSRATQPRPAAWTAARARATPAAVTSSTERPESLTPLAPKVLVVTMSAPAARYWAWMAWTASGRSRFQSSGSYPAGSPAAWSMVPMPPSNKRSRRPSSVWMSMVFPPS